MRKGGNELEDSAGAAILDSSSRSIRAVHSNAVTGFYTIHQIGVQDDVHRAWKQTRWSPFWHLLDRHGLEVDEAGETEFRCQRITVVVLQQLADR